MTNPKDQHTPAASINCISTADFVNRTWTYSEQFCRHLIRSMALQHVLLYFAIYVYLNYLPYSYISVVQYKHYVHNQPANSKNTGW